MFHAKILIIFALYSRVISSDEREEMEVVRSRTNIINQPFHTSGDNFLGSFLRLTWERNRVNKKANADNIDVNASTS